MKSPACENTLGKAVREHGRRAADSNVRLGNAAMGAQGAPELATQSDVSFSECPHRALRHEYKHQVNRSSPELEPELHGDTDYKA
jgi:hypothetical protein